MKYNKCKLFIVITAGPSPLSNWRGVSAAAWKIGPLGTSATGFERGRFGVEVSDNSESDETEAAILALNAALRGVKDKHIIVFVSQAWICDAINGGVDAWQTDWKGRAHKKLWQEYLEIRTSHSLQVEGKRVPGADPEAGPHFKFLRKQARAARDRRSKELGTPTAGFDAIHKHKKRGGKPQRRGAR